MAARKPGRYLAPIALLAIAVAIFMLVRANQSTSTHASTPPVIPRTLAHSPSHKSHSAAARRRVFYTVQPGDTLSGIADRTGVPVATLQSLNPGVNPNALQTGQRLRLHR
jgi:peptidoglycan endopeptidase LytE